MPRSLALIVCTGKDCSRARGFGATVTIAAAVPGSMSVPCQGICDGPVVGVRMGEKVRWYRRIRGQRREALARLVTRGRGRKRLRSAEARRHRGRLRHAGRLRRLDR